MLEIKNLSVNYETETEVVKAVSDVSLTVGEGEALGIVGESGSGKSTIALAIMRLIAPPGRIVGGEVLFDGQDLMKLPEKKMIEVRGAKISLVFQDPFTSLNPVLTVGEQIAEAVRVHQGLNRQSAWEKAVEMLALVQINNPAARAGDYPHQFSGGMRQRAMIAMALACRPRLLLADEPTTALDVTIQAEIIRLLKELQKELGLAIVYITHNFGIVRAICDRVVVVHQGVIVEEGKIPQLLDAPKASYTKKLIDCLKTLRGER
jgi:ABC-type dipeptide/oligopeptide/nickel transport system ATPase component